MSSLSINVEILAGTNIEQAIREASELAVRLKVAYVIFKFNGISMNVRQYAHISRLVEGYNEALKNTDKFVV